MATDRDGDSDRVTILIDTNAFLMASQFRIDLFRELNLILGLHNPVVPDVVIHELEGLARGRGKDAAAARLGLVFAKKCDVIKTSGSGMPDDMIFSIASGLQCGVVTNDRRLRNQILDAGLPVVSMKGKQKLELIRK